MLRRWIRGASARIGIPLPFPGVICVHGRQAVSLDGEGRADIRFTKWLVFLEQPAPGDLHDVYSLGTGGPTSALIYTSPDAREISREETNRGRQMVCWFPREPVVLNALYEHQYGWQPSTTFTDSAVCIEYDCSIKTGVFTIELDAPTKFDTAVLFERPRWPLRLTERHIIRTALRRLHDADAASSVSVEGSRVVSELRGPRTGKRYVLVAFRTFGVADCEQWLMRTSRLHRWQRAVSGWSEALTG